MREQQNGGESEWERKMREQQNGGESEWERKMRQQNGGESEWERKMRQQQSGGAAIYIHQFEIVFNNKSIIDWNQDSNRLENIVKTKIKENFNEEYPSNNISIDNISITPKIGNQQGISQLILIINIETNLSNIMVPVSNTDVFTDLGGSSVLDTPILKFSKESETYYYIYITYNQNKTIETQILKSDINIQNEQISNINFFIVITLILLVLYINIIILLLKIVIIYLI